MKSFPFHWLALAIGLIFGIVLIRSGAADPEGEHGLPLLTLLFMSELGFIVSAIGAGVGVSTYRKRRGDIFSLAVALACAALTAGFLIVGLALWRGAVTG